MKTIHKVAAICIDNNKLLLVRKAKKGIWTTLGGKMEEGETEEECLRREVLEELNSPLELIRFIGRWEAISNKDLFILSAYLISLTGEPHITEPELEDFKYIGKKEFAFIRKAWLKRDKKIPVLAAEHLIPKLQEEKILDW